MTTIRGYNLPQVQHPRVNQLNLYPHQAVMLDEWDDHDAFLLVTKTGSGKTIGSALPVVLNRHRREDNCAVFVYPTNELIRDQERSIAALLDKLEVKYRVWTPENANEKVGDEEIVLVRVDAGILEDFGRIWHLRRKADVLERLLQADKPKLLLINPDILYLLYSLRYGRRAANVVATLQHYQTIVFDEVHLYGGVELAHVLFLIHAAREMGSFRRVVLLSATPHPKVREWVDRLLAPYEVTMEAVTPHPPKKEPRPVAQDVTMEPLLVGKGRAVEVTKEQVLSLLPRLRQLRQKRAGDAEYVPAVVILNSVVKAIDLEDTLLAEGFGQNEIVPIRGMARREARRLRQDQLLVIGTSAIEVGIDFQCDYLIFEAGDAASFMQRFGRLGRHQPGTAYLLGNQRECAAMQSLPDPLERIGFETMVHQFYPYADARAWFVGTEMGVFAALSQAFNIRRCIEEDRRGDFGAKDEVYRWLDEMAESYAGKMGLRGAVRRAQRIYKRFAGGRGSRWVGDYLGIDAFRTSLPSVPVKDLAEEARRGPGAGQYDVEIKALLQRATNPRWEGRRATIDGYHDNHRVTVNFSFKDQPEKAGTFLSTTDYPTLMLARDGKLDAGSHIMSHGERKHIFVFVPYEVVRDQLDWRLSWFFCGGYPAQSVLAFDGDALLLKEIFERERISG